MIYKRNRPHYEVAVLRVFRNIAVVNILDECRHFLGGLLVIASSHQVPGLRFVQPEVLVADFVVRVKLVGSGDGLVNLHTTILVAHGRRNVNDGLAVIYDQIHIRKLGPEPLKDVGVCLVSLYHVLIIPRILTGCQLGTFISAALATQGAPSPTLPVSRLSQALVFRNS